MVCRSARRVRGSVSVPIWTNGIGDAQRYFDFGSAQLIPVSDRGFTEQYTRHAEWPIDRFPTSTEWQRTGAMTSQIGAKYAALTKVWVAATQDVKDRWHRYALTTFLLSAVPGGLYYCTSQRATTVTPLNQRLSVPATVLAPTAKQLRVDWVPETRDPEA